MEDLEAMAAALEASGDFRVYRRLLPRTEVNAVPSGAKTWRGLVLDVETTGLAADDEIIELAMVPFTYGRDGTIFQVGDAFDRLREPGKPIPAEVSELTGIDASMVAGCSIPPEEVDAFVADADLVIAHKADFDRNAVERLYPVFRDKPWACSLSQVPWKDEGFAGARLGQLLNSYGLFHDAHRAGDDCRAVIELLARPLPKSGVSAMSRLLEAARMESVRIWASNTPFEFKDKLKARGYKWIDGTPLRGKAWVIDVSDDKLEDEMAYLRSEIYRRDSINLPLARVTAYDRFTDRAVWI
ncbi:3'-5' exonuclease [Xanthobacter sp. DSM 14520]|uniref:3'-5' exonuclease n=1 Tax=Xanthobacter autotrophicus (strain ATCC BAA-1158 / Py2) TaxID=78245 RepID=UPI0037285F7A